MGNHHSALVLGDNIFYGHDLIKLLANENQRDIGASVFAYHVTDPERYGVVDFEAEQRSILARKSPRSPKATTP